MLSQLRFRDLEYLVAVAEHLSFAKAADALCVTQPTLSNQIRRIEEAIDGRLFDREGRSVRVTPEGERILVHAREILARFYEFDRAARGQEDFVGRRLRLGAISTLAPYLGPPLVDRLRRENPGGAVRFVEGLTESLEKRVAAGELDFALTATLPREPSLRAHRIAEEGLLYVSAAPIAEDPFAPDAEIRSVILMQEGHCFRDFVYDAVARASEGRLSCLSDALSPASLSTLIGLVRGGAGDALLPAPLLAAEPSALEGLQTRELSRPGFTRGVHMIMRATREGHVDMARLAKIAAEVHASAAAPAASAPAA